MDSPKDKMPPGISANANCSWCTTSVKETSICYLWTIEKFSCLQKGTGKFIESSTFPSTDHDGNKWRLRLYPKGLHEDSKDYVSLLLCHPSGDFPLSVYYEFAILNGSKNKVNRRNSGNSYAFESKDRVLGFPKFVRHEHVAFTSSKDELIIFCEVIIRGGQVNQDGCFDVPDDKNSASTSNQVEDLGHLLDSKNFSDVVLVTKDGEVHAHKAILTLRSAVFAAMFVHDMEEKQKNRVEIVDVDHAVLQEMIRFVYTGKTPAMDDAMATRLLAAAEKYAVEGLKNSCERALSVKLTPDKVVELIPMASMYSANLLKGRIIQYLKLNTVHDAVDQLWDIVITHHPNQAVDVCCKSLNFSEAN